MSPHKPQDGVRRKTRRPPATLASLLALGKSYLEIADLLMVDREAVSKWARLPKIQAEVNRIQEMASLETIQRLKGLQSPALDGLSRVLEETDVRASGAVVKAAVAVLDRTGFRPRQEVELSGGLDLGLDNQTDAQLDAEVLEVAIGICIERGRPDLAEGLRELLAA